MNTAVKHIWRGVLRTVAFGGIGVGALLCFLVLLLLADDGTVQCENAAGERVLFSYDPSDGTVAVGAHPTYDEKYEWVDFLEVRRDGFIAVVSQNTYDPEVGGIVPVKYVSRYTGGDGFASWSYVPHSDAAGIAGLDTLPRQEPDAVFPVCKKAVGGVFLQTLLTALRV